MTDEMTVTRDTTAVGVLEDVGRAANHAAAMSAFADYRLRKATNTLRQQDGALELFANYLAEVTPGGAPSGAALGNDPRAWVGCTWGLVTGFVKWMLLRGYAVGTINGRLSTVKTYAKLAAQAGALDGREMALILTVSGYAGMEGKRADEKREEAGRPTRWEGKQIVETSGGFEERDATHKKRDSIHLARYQADDLKSLPDPDTPQGRRDALLLAILLDLGLRCGELAGLAVGDFDLEARKLTFYREKVGTVQTMDLTITAYLWTAVEAWFDTDAPALGPVLRASRKGGVLGKPGMSKRAITARVRYLGSRIGIEGLSAHDLRHTWATLAALSGTTIDRLQNAGGWKSPSMPLRYIEAAKVANEGVVLD